MLMKMLKLSDEIFENLKSFVVDPFDDTPDAVIERLIDIANKAKKRWSPFDETPAPKPLNCSEPEPLQGSESEYEKVVL